MRMDLDQQIQTLIDNAPQDGTTHAAVEAIAPAFKLIAAQLKHPQYYVLQNLEQQWVMTTLNHREDPALSKTVIYAYPTLKDVASNPSPINDPQILALPVPVIHILFQMLAMKTVDSAVFFEVPGNSRIATEVTRQNLQSIVQLHLQKMKGDPTIPSDIA